MGPEKNQLIRKMQMNYYCEVGQGLQTPLCVFTGSLSGRRGNTGWCCRLSCLLFFLKCVKMNFNPTSLFKVKVSPGCLSQLCTGSLPSLWEACAYRACWYSQITFYFFFLNLPRAEKEPQFKFIYFNHMNLAEKSTIHMRKTPSVSLASVHPDLMKILGDINSDFSR